MNPITVTQLNKYIKRVLDSDEHLKVVAVRGEITNLTAYKSGHLYFGIKDEESQIPITMFKSYADKLKFRPQNGMKIVITGYVSAYVKTGCYQFYATEMIPDGIGELHIAYEQLKAELEAKGMFTNKDHKLPLPKFPEKIGVITSSSGAAVHDIINVVSRRWPLAQIKLYPSVVQGTGTEASLIKALKCFEEKYPVDLIIIGRGGGSIEDLWGFNGKDLAYQIYGMRTPIISAVGHETDYTICDFVSSLRAPTPSAAAEISVPLLGEIFDKLNVINEYFHDKMQRCFDLLMQDVDQTDMSLNVFFENLSNRVERKLSQYGMFFKEMIQGYVPKKQAMLEKTVALLDQTWLETMKDGEYRLDILIANFQALNPLRMMESGFSLVQNEHRKVVRSVDEVALGDNLDISFVDGNVKVRIIDRKKKEKESYVERKNV